MLSLLPFQLPALMYPKSLLSRDIKADCAPTFGTPCSLLLTHSNCDIFLCNVFNGPRIFSGRAPRRCRCCRCRSWTERKFWQSNTGTSSQWIGRNTFRSIRRDCRPQGGRRPRCEAATRTTAKQRQSSLDHGIPHGKNTQLEKSECEQC